MQGVPGLWLLCLRNELFNVGDTDDDLTTIQIYLYVVMLRYGTIGTQVISISFIY